MTRARKGCPDGLEIFRTLLEGSLETYLRIWVDLSFKLRARCM